MKIFHILHDNNTSNDLYILMSVSMTLIKFQGHICVGKMLLKFVSYPFEFQLCTTVSHYEDGREQVNGFNINLREIIDVSYVYITLHC